MNSFRSKAFILDMANYFYNSRNINIEVYITLPYEFLQKQGFYTRYGDRDVKFRYFYQGFESR